MCGITGFVGPYDQSVLKIVTDMMTHRGPDDAGYYHALLDRSGYHVGIGHRRLSIIDLEGGHQPIWNEDATKAIVFNGEIYNYRELSNELTTRGHRFASHSDTEVILHGFEEYGEAIVDRLEGMFAFAIWDNVHRNWFLARDRFGIKPLYYCQPQPDSFAFASEIKPLLWLLGRIDVNLAGLYHYLLYGWISSQETIFRKIHQLPPGHRLWWTDGKTTAQQYWRLRRLDQRLTAEEWAEGVRSTLRQAVESHLISDVPVGITLSGGLDSSSILALMAQATEVQRIQCFTIGYGRTDDETRYSRLVAAHVGVQAYEHVVDISQVGLSFEQIVFHLEEPLAHPVIGTTYFLSHFVRRHLKVALIGEGSDELFGGYPHYQLFRWPFGVLPPRVRHKYFLAAACLMPTASTLAQLLDPGWLDLELLHEVSHVYDRYFAGAFHPDSALLWELENELVYNQLARIDKLMMAHSVEARVPFLDRAFAELAYSIPFELKLRHGREKYILREAVRDLLPPAVVWRPKSGRGGTQAILRNLISEGLASQIREWLSDSRIRQRAMFRPQEIKAYLTDRSFATHYHPIEGRRRAKFLLAIAVLECWCRLFLDGQAFHGFMR